MKKIFLLTGILCLFLTLVIIFKNKIGPSKDIPDNPNDPWRQKLTAEEYHILREKGTEIPFSGKLNHETRKGTYYSVGCDKPVFRSEDKYDSGTGWPSFSSPINQDAVVLRNETGLGDDRIEVLDTCGNHLGHVFDDGPPPTGKRFCMNSIALKFVPDQE